MIKTDKIVNLSIVIPVYNEQNNIAALVNEIKKNISSSIKYEIIIVDDGSTDNTLKELKLLCKRYKDIIIIKHKKNYGQSISIRSGILSSNKDFILTLDGDGQNDPKDIIKMIDVYNENENCLVHGFRKNRSDPYFTKILPSKIANYIVRKFTNSKIIDHGCSLKIFDKNLIDVNEFFGDFHRLFAAQIRQDIKVVEIEVNHRPRIKGKSKYGFERVLRVLIDLIFINFTKKDRSSFYTLGTLGLLSFFLSLISLTYMLYLKIIMSRDFVDTPLPIIFIFFTLSGFIFFALNLVLETIKRDKKLDIRKTKDYKIVK